MDHAIYYESGGFDSQTLDDGTKRRTFFSSSLAMEVFNDPFGVLAEQTAPAMSGGVFAIQIDVAPSGAVELSGELFSTGGTPSSVWTFGPVADSVLVSLDDDGFAADGFLFAPNVPFTLESSFLTTTGTLTGVIRLQMLVR